jgi:hypothetical protein
MSITRASWMVSVRCTSADAKVLVTDTWLGRDLLKARLPASPCHPRALLTLCEGLALWHGIPLCVAVSAEADAQRCFERIFYGGGLVEPRSPLITLETRPPRERQRRARQGQVLGDFRQLRLVEDDR